MNGIIIAAGRGARMLPYTSESPKCMLPVNGRPILYYAIERLRKAGCDTVVVVTGHLAERIHAPGCTLVYNADPEGTNVLHSLMHAREWFGDDLLVTYSDIIVEPFVYEDLVTAPGDITLAVDTNWRDYYVDRMEHGVEEAEKAIFQADGDTRARLVAIGKHLEAAAAAGPSVGEFTGLWKMTRAGARRFRDRFEALDRVLDPKMPFRASREWRKAYATDLFTELLAEQEPLECLTINRGWAEIDTVEDYRRLPLMLEAQRLYTLLEPNLAR